MIMKILIVNDDGYNSKYLHTLVKVLSEYGECYIMAPYHQQSGKSHGITLHQELEFESIEIPFAIKATKLNALPADCTKMGILYYKEDFDLVVSGVNNGPNLGYDNLYSGTVSSALEGVINGYKSIAFSTDFDNENDLENNIKKSYEYIIKNNLLSNEYLLNVNFPIKEYEKAKGIKVTNLDKHAFYTTLEERPNNKLIYKGFFLDDTKDKNSDIYNYLKGYITISPILVDRTNYEVLSKH